MLDSTMKNQIKEHLQKFVDSEAVARRKRREEQKSFRIYKTIPIWNKCSLNLTFNCDPEKMFRQIFLNIEKDNEQKSEKDKIKKPEKLVKLVTENSLFHVSEFTKEHRKELLDLLKIKISVFPVFDVVRVLMCHDKFVSDFWSDFELKNKVFERMADSKDFLEMAMASKILSNFIAKKRKRPILNDEDIEIAKQVLRLLDNFYAKSTTLEKSKHCGMFRKSVVVVGSNLAIWTGRDNLNGLLDDYKKLMAALLSFAEELTEEKVLKMAVTTIASLFLKIEKMEKTDKNGLNLALRLVQNYPNLKNLEEDLEKLIE
ncbi:hypothetical protein MHBO_002982 [Bonamia ostreae]|uniref:PUL domain-containing protein n=1 Tax=Bonamia ostreae TaxID=126728 RepID=A0ABV2AP49_9EUKA